MNCIALAFHDVSGVPPASPGVGRYTLSREDFDSHLEALARTSCRVRVGTGIAGGQPQPPVLLTFDDGRISSLTTVAPALESFGWRGHFFVVSGWIGLPGFLGVEDIRELRARGHVVGSHSATHPERMSQLAWPRLLDEWSASRCVLGGILDEDVVTASVPNGYGGSRVAKAAALCGFKYLFTSEPATRIIQRNDCQIVGRYCIRRHTPPHVTAELASGAALPRWREALLWSAKEVAKRGLGDSYLSIRQYLLAKLSL